jgi:hypothetical protein
LHPEHSKCDRHYGTIVIQRNLVWGTELIQYVLGAAPLNLKKAWSAALSTLKCGRCILRAHSEKSSPYNICPGQEYNVDTLGIRL